MKLSRFFSLSLVLGLLSGLLAGCGADNTPGSVSGGASENTTAATVLSAEEDTQLKAELQQNIDAILNTETNIVHSDTYIPGETYTGTAYYVSADGNDNNDGLTPETAWQSAGKVGKESMEGGILQFGDAVFFRRGDIFRSFDFEPGMSPFTCRIDGITYSSYGAGDKPVITSSPESGAGADKWQLVYEDESGVKIWKFYNDLTDIGMVVCDDEVVAKRIYEWCDSDGGSSEADSYYTSCKLDYYWMHDEGGIEQFGELLPLEETLTENLTFVSRPARWAKETGMDSSVTGPLYLRCDEGNPGDLFDSIEFSGFEIFGLISLEANDLVFDNLSLKYTGPCYIKNWYHWKAYQNTVIQNCEFAYGGGAVSGYRTTEMGDNLVVAEADGIYCVVRNATIQNNYFHDGAAITYEASNFEITEPTQNFGYYHILNNIVVNCMGVRLDSSVDPELQQLDSVIIRDNQIWNTGRIDNGKYIYNEGALQIWGCHFGECIVENNILYCTENGHPTGSALLSPDVYTDETGYTLPILQNNTYIQHNGGKLAMFWSHGEEVWYIDKEEDVKKFIDRMGDTTSKFYIIPAP